MFNALDMLLWENCFSHSTMLLNETYNVTPGSTLAIEDFFKIVHKFQPHDVNKDHYWTFWMKFPRCSFEEFLEHSAYGSKREAREEYRYKFSEPYLWYNIQVAECTNGYRAVFVNRSPVYSEHKRATQESFIGNLNESFDGPLDEADLFRALTIHLEDIYWDCQESDLYNETIDKELPKKYRYGYILRKDYLDIIPEERTAYQKAVGEESWKKFLLLTEELTDDSITDDTLSFMTANQFYEACKIGYLAALGDKCSINEDAKTLYYRFADGRDDGLKDIDPDDPEAFRKWHRQRFAIGHPFEVIRGGNYTHISLFVVEDQKTQRYYFSLSGVSYVCSVDTIKFYNALRENHLPVQLQYLGKILGRLLEQDYIGILPDGSIERYQQKNFPVEVEDTWTMPYEKDLRKKVEEATTWIPERKLQIIKT